MEEMVATDGKNYNVVFYSLEMIIAVGYRVRGSQTQQLRNINVYNKRNM